MPDTISGVPVAPEKEGRRRYVSLPYQEFGLKDTYMCKKDKYGLPIPSKNPNDYEVPVNTSETIVLFNGEPQNELNTANKTLFMNKAWEAYTKEFTKKALVGYNGRSVARNLTSNFNRAANNGLGVEAPGGGGGGGAAEAEAEAEAEEDAGPSVARALFRKSRKSKKSRKSRKSKKSRKSRK